MSKVCRTNRDMARQKADWPEVAVSGRREESLGGDMDLSACFADRSASRFWLLTGGVLLGMVLVGWGTWNLACHMDAVRLPNRPDSTKEFRRPVAEGLRVTRHGIWGIDLVRCGVCRLEKRKKGLLTFGGFNILVLEELSVVLPPDSPRVSEEVEPRPANDSRAVMRGLGVSDDFLLWRGVPARFSGVSVKGLTVSRLSDDKTRSEALFQADSAEAVREGLALTGCRVFESSGKSRPVRKAILAMSRRSLVLRWQGGEMVLSGTKSERERKRDEGDERNDVGAGGAGHGRPAV